MLADISMAATDSFARSSMRTPRSPTRSVTHKSSVKPDHPHVDVTANAKLVVFAAAPATTERKRRTSTFEVPEKQDSAKFVATLESDAAMTTMKANQLSDLNSTMDVTVTTSLDVSMRMQALHKLSNRRSIGATTPGRPIAVTNATPSAMTSKTVNSEYSVKSAINYFYISG